MQHRQLTIDETFLGGSDRLRARGLLASPLLGIARKLLMAAAQSAEAFLHRRQLNLRLSANQLLLVTLFALHRDLALDVFRSFWALSLVTYLFVTLSAFAQDGPAARASWREAVTFPGLISLAIIVCAVIGPLADRLPDWVLLFAYVWLSASMLAAYLVRRLEAIRRLRWLARPLLYVVGYGPLLCAITAAAYLAELRRADLVWEKTEKTGTVGNLA